MHNLHRTTGSARSIHLCELDNKPCLQGFHFEDAVKSSRAVLMNIRPIEPLSLCRNDFTDRLSCISLGSLLPDSACSTTTFNFSQLMRTTLFQPWHHFVLLQSTINADLGLYIQQNFFSDLLCMRRISGIVHCRYSGHIGWCHDIICGWDCNCCG